MFKRKGYIYTRDIFYVNNEGKDTFRLGFSRVKVEDIELGIKIIGSKIGRIKNKGK